VSHSMRQIIKEIHVYALLAARAVTPISSLVALLSRASNSSRARVRVFESDHCPKRSPDRLVKH
jgi:hypothetical protein